MSQVKLPTVKCRLCGLIIRGDDDVIDVPSFDPPVAHVACAESAHVGGSGRGAAEASTFSQWSKGIGQARIAGPGSY